MDIKINDISASERELEATFNYDEIKSDIAAEVQKQSKKIQLPGFRKGKVPLTMIKKMYGDSLEYEASEKVANDKFWDVSKKKELKPIGQPVLKDLKFKPGDDLYFKILFETYPQLEVKDYTGQEIEIPDFTVRDEDIEKEIDYIRRSNSTKEKAEVIGETKDFIVDVEITRIQKNGEIFGDSKPEKMQLDFSNEKIQPEILENAKGKKTGEFFTFSFKDERTIKNAEGKEEQISETYIYKADILEIKKTVLPELNEELIKKVTKDKVTTEEQLKADIKKDIQSFYDQRNEEFLNNKLISMIIKNNDFTPPSTLVNNILSELIKQEVEKSKKEGYKKYNREQAAERLMPSAVNEVKWYLLKSEIKKKEVIKISDDDLKQLAEKDAEKTGIAVDKLITYYKSSNYGERLIDKKLFDLLKEKNNIKKVDPEKFSKTETKESK